MSAASVSHDAHGAYALAASQAAATQGLWVEVQQDRPMRVHARLHCPPGELLALVGRSGAGKTSLLRILAGLLRPSEGHVAVDGQVWSDTQAGIHLPPQQRRVGLMFQHYALMPHLSALDNVALALLHLPRAQRLAQARQWLDRVQLTREQQARRPAALSGGQQQRVALARALARAPRLLLLDEPFSAVDQMLRQDLYRTLADVRADLHIPIVLVTHDLQEARHLADTLAVMDGGEVLQQGSPARLYRSPRNARVADLLGVQNRFQGVWLGPCEDQPGMGWLGWLADDSDADAPVRRLRVPDKGRIPAGQRVSWIIQADGLHLLDAPVAPGNPSVLCAQVAELRYLGDLSLATLTLTEVPGTRLRLTLAGAQRTGLKQGQRLCVRLDPDWVHVMPTRRP
ncbi:MULTISPECIES: ABC transporter ATP-binding protein [unclassified Tepidimonas]|uniref:ABC transporter ATP-binding protein n=1 Tax=unclassified Tepidimonas TaxID=2631705 RepID=UPI003C7BCC76